MKCTSKVTLRENVNATAVSEHRGSATLIRYWFAAVTVMAALIAISTSSHAESGKIRVMTQNMDEGTNYQELLAAHSPGEFVAAVTTTYQNILATKPAERAAAIAREIMREQPDIVGLQEASIVRTGAVAPAATVQSDLLQSLLDELAKLGQKYTVVSIMPGLDAEAPSTLGFDVRLTTQDAILVRRIHDSGDLRIANNHTQRFLTNLTVPTAVGPITLHAVGRPST